MGELNDVALIDESRVVKQGDDSSGLVHQYCGSACKVANGQVGAYLGYVSRKDCNLADTRLFISAEWFDDEHIDKRRAALVRSR